MITASHNPAIDNGAKLVDPRGEMLEASWEQHASLLANAETTSDLLKALTSLVSELKIDMSKSSRVVFGRDTRPSGEKLVKALQAGLEAMGCDEPKDMGITTTPCLHYMVKGSNLKQEAQIRYGAPSEQGYVQKLATAFTKLMVSPRALPDAGPLLTDIAERKGEGIATRSGLRQRCRRRRSSQTLASHLGHLANSGHWNQHGRRIRPQPLLRGRLRQDQPKTTAGRTRNLEKGTARLLA